MTGLRYTPDEDIKVHEEGAIRLLCKQFQSHENGLPELLKNSADAYIREDFDLDRRIIVVLLVDGRPATISCLDFCGMSTDDIESRFRNWADPDAAKGGLGESPVQGGHGNGGKCYMCQMFEDYSVIHTVKRGRGNRYGVAGGSVRFGYIPDRAAGRNFPVGDMRSELHQHLNELKSSLQSLPLAAVKALEQAEGFTLVKGVAPKGYPSRIPVDDVITNLQNHPQMYRTLELCKVYVVANGRCQNRGQPITLKEIPPLKGGEVPRVIRIPEALKDPATGLKVPTTGAGAPPGTVTLRTSATSFRGARKARHNIVFRTSSGFVGYVPVAELDVQSPYRDRIYGECYLEAIEPYKQNDRSRPADSPLTRAIRRFLCAKVEEYAKEFEEQDKLKYNQEESNALSKMNQALDRWKNRFLQGYMQGLWGPGRLLPPPPPAPLPAGTPVRIEVALTHARAGIGVGIRPSVRFFDARGQQIRPTPYHWVSEDTNVAMVDEDLLMLNTFSPGRTVVYAETLHGGVRSNNVLLEVVRIRQVRVNPSRVEVPVGSRRKLTATCRLANGEETEGVYLLWTEADSSVARVSASGLVYGFSLGETEVVAGDDQCLASEPAIVVVVPGDGKGPGDQRGRGFPTVLVSGEIDRDPDTHEYVYLSKDDPPVYQRPGDVERNIWWINSAAPLARLYLNKDRGYGYESREWRMYHLERYIDIIVQIALTHGPEEHEEMSVDEWIMRWGAEVVEIQQAAVADLASFIASGELPEA